MGRILALTPVDIISSMVGYEHVVLNGTFFSAAMIGRKDILRRLVREDRRGL